MSEFEQLPELAREMGLFSPQGVFKGTFDGLPASDSIWGNLDVLNNLESSQANTGLAKKLVGEVRRSMGGEVYVARRALTGRPYRMPLVVYPYDPQFGISSLDDFAVGSSGPYQYGEAVAAGYLLTTAAVNLDILDGVVEGMENTNSPIIDQISQEFGGEKRYLPLGLFTLNDFLGSMMIYRAVTENPGLSVLDIEDEYDLSLLIKVGRLPLARAFKEDGYLIGDNFQATLDRWYIGNQNLFIPFAGKQPKTLGDWQMVGIGLYTGVRIFRSIDQAFKYTALEN